MKTHDRLKNCAIFAADRYDGFAVVCPGSTPAKPADAKPDDAQMMAMMMDLAKPGENHKILEESVGSWTYTTKFWMSADTNTPPMESSGTAVHKANHGRTLFPIRSHGQDAGMPGADGKMMDMDFHGMEIDGFDNVKKKFVSSWVDNMGTGIMLSEGTYDPATKTITYTRNTNPCPE